MDTNRISLIRSLLAFSITLLLCLFMTVALVANRSRVEKLTMEQLILEKSLKITNVISDQLYKTYILSALVQNNGGRAYLEPVAAVIADNPAIQNILIAPDGIVSDVYPLEGNEAVLGHDFFSDALGNKEAVMARERGELVMGGPFDAVQGGRIIVGRLPVYVTDDSGADSFWGLVSVTLKYPQVLEAAGLSELPIQGFAYEIWRINPDNNEKQIISANIPELNGKNFVEKHISILNADWYFRIFSLNEWYQFSETWVAVFISIFLSILIAVIVKNNQDLNRLRIKLEDMSNTDMLTGIYNRRFFMKEAEQQLDRIKRNKSSCFIIMIDLDHFKNINDKYGHPVGDAVLKSIAERGNNVLRKYDLFARYGGEEFIIFAADLDKDAVINLAARIARDISHNPILFENFSISVTASFGIAPIDTEKGLQAAIAMADDALYQAKREGRDRVVFYPAIIQDDA